MVTHHSARVRPSIAVDRNTEYAIRVRQVGRLRRPYHLGAENGRRSIPEYAAPTDLIGSDRDFRIVLEMTGQRAQRVDILRIELMTHPVQDGWVRRRLRPQPQIPLVFLIIG